MKVTPMATPKPTEPPKARLPAIAQISDASTALMVALPLRVRFAAETYARGTGRTWLTEAEPASAPPAGKLPMNSPSSASTAGDRAGPVAPARYALVVLVIVSWPYEPASASPPPEALVRTEIAPAMPAMIVWSDPWTVTPPLTVNE